MSSVDEAPVIGLCFCPPMPDPDDPDLHRAGCYHAEVLYRRAFWNRLVAETVEVLVPRNLYFNRRCYVPSTLPTGCYEASFGWVHVRSVCRCERRRR